MKTVSYLNLFSCLAILLCGLGNANVNAANDYKVTFDGDNGVKARIFNSNSVNACVNCHYNNSTELLGSPSFFTNGGAGSTAIFDKVTPYKTTANSYINSGYMPYADTNLNAEEKALMQAWIDDGSLEATAPVINNESTSNISKTSAKFEVKIDPSGRSISDFRFNYGTDSNNLNQSEIGSFSERTALGSGGGGDQTYVSNINYDFYSVKTISKTLTNLTCGTTYYWRLSATNNIGTSNSILQSFTTSDCNLGPTLTTSSLSNATEETLYQITITVSDPENDSISFALTTAPDGMTINSSTGVISWTPSETQSGNTFNVTVTATDSIADVSPTDTETFQITALEVNDAPTISATATLAATEDSAFSYTPTVTDPDDSSFQFELLSGPAGMTINISTGEVNWTPQQSDNASNSFTIKVSDQDTSNEQTDTETFSVDLTFVNDAPTITSTPNTTAAEATLYTYTIDASDEENDVLSYTISSGPIGATIDSTTGLLQWTPPQATENYNQLFTVEVFDSALTDEQSFSVSIGATNDAPEFTSTAITTATEKVDYEYQVVAEDPDSTDLTFSLSVSPAGMTIDSTTGLISWTPPAATSDFTDNVTVQVSDANSIVEQTFEISVTTINEAPVITSSPITSATEDIAYEYQIELTDPDDTNNGTEISFELTEAPTGMTVSTLGAISWTPSNEQTGEHSITIAVSDGLEDGVVPDVQSFTLSVLAVNDPPVITSTPSTSIVRYSTYEYQIAVADPDNSLDELTVSFDSTDIGFVLSDSNLLSFVTDENTPSSISVTITAADDGSDGAQPTTQEITISINDFNDPPVITSSPNEQAIEDEVFEYQLTVDDRDDTNNGSDLSFSLTNAPEGMVVSNTGLISWTPVEGILLAEDIVLTVTDGGEFDAPPDSQTFSISVTPVNDAPIITSTPLSNAIEGSLWQYQVEVNDPDDSLENNELTISVSSALDDSLSLSETGELSWTPIEGQTSSGTITITVSDGGEDGSTAAVQSFVVLVTSVNQGPAVEDVTTQQATEDKPFSLQLNVSDPDDPNDGESIGFALLQAPSGMAISNTGLLSWTPDNDSIATNTIRVEVTDGGEDNAEPATIEFNLEVGFVNDAPIIISEPEVEVIEEQTFVYDLELYDEETQVDDLSISITNQPTGMQLNGLQISWTPTTEESASNIQISVSDGENIVSQQFDITVIPINDAPLFTSTPITAATEDEAYFYAVEVNDEETEASELALTLLSSTNGMTLSDATLAWTPQEGQLESEVTISLSDGENSTEQSFIINVTPVNDAPVITPVQAISMGEGDSLLLPVLVSDVDSTEFDFELSGAPLSMSIDQNGLIDWQAPNFSAGEYTVEVIVDDGGNENNISTMQFALSIALLDQDADNIADYVDNCPATANAEQLDFDSDGSGDNCDFDDDNDGIPDEFESTHGLDPFDPADADLDIDGDTASNLDEYKQCESIGDSTCLTFSRDSVAPVITVQEERVTVISTGPYTAASLSATAIDAVDGETEVSLDNLGPYSPGRHELVWTASDKQGNTATLTQQLDVLPLIKIGADNVITEGQTFLSEVRLNGPAPEYPIEILYEVSGSAANASDTALTDGSIIIQDGLAAHISVETFVDQEIETGEELFITLTGTSNFAALPEKSVQQRLLLVERNVAPQALNYIKQNGNNVTTIFRDQGLVTYQVVASDVNSDPLTITLQTTPPIELTRVNESVNEWLFDPNNINESFLKISTEVSDGSSEITLSSRYTIHDSQPVLSATTDSDNDGISDADEGFGDSDNDRVPDYLDTIDDPSVMITKPTSTTNEVAITSNGLALRLGDLAAASQTGGLMINQQFVTNEAGEPVYDNEYTSIGEAFDFEIVGLNEVITSAKIVIPLAHPIPTNAVFRKFDGNTWNDFVVTNHDQIFSAPKVNGSCPGVGNELYVQGLIAFNHCIQIQVSDGGPNDADGVVNGIIKDPGSIAMTASSTNDNNDNATPLEKPNEPQKEASGAINVVMLILGLLLIGARCTQALANEKPSNWSFDAEAATKSDSNLTKSFYYRDEATDISGLFRGSIGYRWTPSIKHMITLKSFADIEQYSTFTALSSYSLGAELAYSWQNALGFSAPFYRASIKVQQTETVDSDRSAQSVAFQTFMTKRLTTSLTGRIGYEYEQVEANLAVYSNDQHRLFVNIDWSISQHLVSYIVASIIDGDIHSSAQTVFCNRLPADDIYPFIREAEEIEPDKAINDQLCGLWFSYKMPALTTTGTLGFNYAYSHKVSFDVSATLVNSDVSNDVYYERSLLRASILMRF